MHAFGLRLSWTISTDFGADSTSGFCPRDVLLPRVLAMALRLSVCVCHKSVFYRNGWTNRAVFNMGASFDLSHTVL